MHVFQGVADLKNAVGTDLGHTEWHKVTQEQVNLFAEATGDHQWIHTDTERAKEGPFETTIAHGFLTLSLLSTFTAEVYRIEGVKMVINYGTNKVRFPSVVPVGSLLRGGVELMSVEPNSLGYLVTARVTIETAEGSKPACVAESLAVVVP